MFAVCDSVHHGCRTAPSLRSAYLEAPFLLSVNVGFDDLPVCADPGVPENGFRTPSGGLFLERSVTQFHCQDGFTLKGPTKRLCVRHLNGTLGWIPSDKPFCAQEGKVPPSSVEAAHGAVGTSRASPGAHPTCWRESIVARPGAKEARCHKSLCPSSTAMTAQVLVSVEAGEQLRSHKGCSLLRP